MIKVFVILVMIGILVALATSLIFLVKDEGKTKRNIKGLTWRIGLSLSLFLFLFLAFALGWLEPHAMQAI